MKIKNIYKRILVILTVLFVSAGVQAQTGDHIVILWDVTGSLLPPTPEKDLNGTLLTPYSEGNGMWRELKEAVIDCIKFVEEDPSNTITVVTFHDNIRDIYSQKATESGKEVLVDTVTNYKYITNYKTNIVEPIQHFYSILDSSKINYMFLFTDGDNDQPATQSRFIPTLDEWTARTEGKNAYGFYVLVHPKADKPEVRASIEPQKNFWIVPDAKVRVNICALPSTIKYNFRDQKGPQKVKINGKFNAEGEVVLKTDDEYYAVECSNADIKDGVIEIEVKAKREDLPQDHTIALTPELSGANAYTFIGPENISLEVSNLPKRSVDVSVADNNFGEAVYYKPMGNMVKPAVPATTTIKVDFSNQAKVEGSSARLQVYFVDKKNGERLTAASHKFKVYIDNEETDVVMLKPGMSDITLSIVGESDTEGGSYYGRLEVTPLENLDSYSINGAQDPFKWKFKFNVKWHPVQKALVCGSALFLIIVLLWMLVLRPIFYPRFGSLRKTFNIPGAAPLIVNFKGARMVVVSATHQKRQSMLNRLLTGKIIYKVHPSFEAPISFKPSSCRRILVKVPAGAYQVTPNPMPGIGTATIIDTKKHLKISVI